MRERVLLIDGMNAIHRANLSFGAKEEIKQEHVIVYNFFRSLKSLVEQFKPQQVFFVLEGRPEFRYSIFPEYKANRIKTAEKTNPVYAACDLILEILNKLPVTVVRASDYECDDAIAVLAHDLKDEEVIIISNDSDFIQLLQEPQLNVQVYNPPKKIFMSPPDYHYVAWKSLRGDKSDNIPKLMSDNKAIQTVSKPELLQQFLSFSENRAAFDKNRSLIELRIFDAELLELSSGTTDLDFVKAYFQKLDFQTMLKEEYWSKFSSAFSGLNL